MVLKEQSSFFSPKSTLSPRKRKFIPIRNMDSIELTENSLFASQFSVTIISRIIDA